MTPRIENAINVLLDAINNRTLAKGSCSACAVGNLIAASHGAIIAPRIITQGFKSTLMLLPIWTSLFFTRGDKTEYKVLKGFTELYKVAFSFPTNEAVWAKAEEMISKSDFTKEELVQIEHAFETNTSILGEDYHKYSNEEVKEDQIKGLSAVIDVMKTFDKVTFSTKKEFVDKVNIVETCY